MGSYPVIPGQLTFPEPGARSTDPGTSHAAARSMRDAVTGQRRLVLRAVAWAGADGATAWDIVTDLMRRGLPMIQQSVVARRLTDLHAAGLIEDSGDTRKGSSSRQLIVWRVTHAGKGAVAA
jgi:hypothetical protein